MANIGLLLAGGSGQRMQKDIPKQFLEIYGKPVLIYTLEAFQNHPEIDAIAVACIEGWEQVLKAYAKQFGITKLKHIVPGGENGQGSIRNGVFELEKHFAPDDIVVVHDGNRPAESAEIISDNIRVAMKYGNAVAAIPCTEAMHCTEDGATSTESYPRDKLMRAQGPQALRLKDICDLHRRALKAGNTNSVCTSTLMTELGEEIYFSTGSEKNIKLTTPDDIDIFKALLQVRRIEWLKD